MNLILSILAGWRLTYMLVQEDGPANSIKKVRVYLLRSKIRSIIPFHCMYCTSIWVSIAITLYQHETMIYLFALSACIILVHELYQKIIL